MVISSYALGMRGTLLQVAIMQVHSKINETLLPNVADNVLSFIVTNYICFL
jgi:hypothetical protein